MSGQVGLGTFRAPTVGFFGNTLEWFAIFFPVHELARGRIAFGKRLRLGIFCLGSVGDGAFTR